MEGEPHDTLEDSPGTPENVADSPLSGDDIAPSPKKSKRGAHKRVVSVPIDDVDGSYRSKGDVYPPSDSWSWRKYGQKPIKGSPYPRGYYRCSSSKGCPARKQVERNRLDPTVLQITYSHEHNHSIPTTNKHHHHHRPSAVATAAAAAASTSPITTSDTVVADTDTDTDNTLPAAKFPPEESAVFANQRDLEPDNSGFSDLTVELGWFSDVGSTTMIESSTIVDTKWSDSEVAVMLPIGEEDQSLFGDLGELPECSMVFRRRYGTETLCYGGTG